MKKSIKIFLGIVLSALVMASPMNALAKELSGKITAWSWNIGAKSLEANIAGFNKKHPNVEVVVEMTGFDQVHERFMAACVSGDGSGLPDVLSLENQGAQIYWARFPDCATNLREFGYTKEISEGFPDFKRVELEVGDKAYAMPWDSGPVVMFYRRDLYEKAAIDPATIETWDDFIAAGKKISKANPGVVMTQASINDDVEFFLMIANQHGCSIFPDDASSITVSSPKCAEALDVVKEMFDDKILTSADWGTKIQSAAASKVATHMFGGWYEGTIRGNMPPEQSGKWGVYHMPSVKPGGKRAANWGGSALVIPGSSKNKEAAFAYLMHVGSVEGQITSMREYGLVPSLINALNDPYVQQPQEFWGGQKVWVDTLETLPDINPEFGTAYRSDAIGVLVPVQLDYLNGKYESAQAALDDAAKQISIATGLPVK